MTAAMPRSRTRPRLTLALALLMLWPALAGNAAQGNPATVLAAYTLNTDLIDESSGLARSQKRGNLLWTLNDSGGEAALYGISTHGRHVATLKVLGHEVGNYDWEDLASYRHQGNDYLLIGDMGDNQAWRTGLTFYLVREPRLPGPLPARPRTLEAEVVRRFEVTYPDGPRDAEALAVDSRENMAYVISKRDARPTLYRFPLGGDPTGAIVTGPLVMEALGPINIPRAPADYVGNPNSFNWVTTMDFDDSLTRAYVGTLNTGYLYRREAGEPWAQALARAPLAFDLPAYPQIESATFPHRNRDSLYITSEQLPARLARIRPRPTP